MTPEEADRIVDAALRSQGDPQTVGEDYFLDARFAPVPWMPSFIRRVGLRIWAIELHRGDTTPEATLAAMGQTMGIDQTVQAAFFVPEGDSYEHLLPACRQNGVALIVKRSDEYEVLLFPGAGPAAATPVVRIPEWICHSLAGLQTMSSQFRTALSFFARRYQRLLDSGAADDERQETLLKTTFLGLLRSDPRFYAKYDALALMRFLELGVLQKGKDHYFHTFVNFLLGCMVIDGCYGEFERFRQTCFPGTRNWSPEYAWLLAVLFHDVGYPVQQFEATSEMVYGVPAMREDQAMMERRQAWESPPYMVARAQLVSLYDHLVQETIGSDWTANPFPLQLHPLDRTFDRAFLSRGHGVASCMRMLMDFFRSARRSAMQIQFLVRHVFLAGLSIPFHDWPVRKYAREEQITEIRTSRFPFASLLMFVDSVQEDRRGEVDRPDILTSIHVDGAEVEVEMNLALLTAEELVDKKREASDVKSFLEEDGLRFRYPPELT